MRFGILGPLSVADSGAEAAITAGRDRTVLALLLLHQGRIVGVEDLIDAVWGQRPPATARGQLQTCVSRLRRSLPGGAILTDPAGYGISIVPDDLDATRFTRLVAQAREVAPEDPDTARSLFREALALWRGPALTGLDARGIRQRAAVLDEQHATAIEDWIDLELAGGRDRDLVAELTGLVEQFPLRERMRVQLMLILYRVGRQADALAEYRRARVLLREELGIEPGPALQDLHRRILTGDVAETRGEVTVLAPVDILPRAVDDFTGRGEVVARLVAGIVAAPVGSPQVRVIDGMAGSGKTTVAVHVAGLVRDRFPDARLFIDLHGHSERRPVEPAAALVTLLRQLGVPADRIPDGRDERVRLWRAELAARRALIVLDNAASTAQVTPLLPASGAALTLVTSRRRLTGLDAVRPESLSVLAEADAVVLLGRIVGERAEAEPGAAAEVVRRCGCLPLAIRLAGARLAHRPRWRVADLVRRLGESPLPELAAEDRTVADAFALSYGQLPEGAQRMFRRLGLHPAERFGAVSVAALCDLSLEDAQDLLDDLVDVHLVEEPEADRYRLHDLVRQFAAALAAGVSVAGRAEALIGLADLHLHATATLARPSEIGIALQTYPAGPPLRPELVKRAVAEPEWLEHQRPDLSGLVGAVAQAGDPRRAWQLARVSWSFLYLRSYTSDLIAVLSLARTIAEQAGDDQGVTVVSSYLASGYYRTGQLEESLRLLRGSLERELRAGNRLGEVRCRANLVGVLTRLGRLTEALEEGRRAYESSVLSGGGTVARLSNTASVMIILGRYREAQHLARIALQHAAERADERRAANALISLGQVRRELGQTAQAARLVRASLRIAVRIGARATEAEARHELGRVVLEQGQAAESIAHLLAALRLMRETGGDGSVAAASNDLASALLTMGDEVGAREVRGHALAVARQTGIAFEQGRALAGLADCVEQDDPPAARRYRRQALELFTEMGVPERFAVAARLGSGADQLRVSDPGGRMVE